jgi:hypothetical protein
MAVASDETPVEARIARLEADVSHIRSDVADVKLDVRALRNRVDDIGEKHTDRLTSVDDKLCTRMDAIEARLTARLERMERDLASAKVWALLLFIAQAAAVYGTLARTMGWI